MFKLLHSPLLRGHLTASTVSLTSTSPHAPAASTPTRLPLPPVPLLLQHLPPPIGPLWPSLLLPASPCSSSKDWLGLASHLGRRPLFKQSFVSCSIPFCCHTDALTCVSPTPDRELTEVTDHAAHLEHPLSPLIPSPAPGTQLALKSTAVHCWQPSSMRSKSLELTSENPTSAERMSLFRGTEVVGYSDSHSPHSWRPRPGAAGSATCCPWHSHAPLEPNSTGQRHNAAGWGR